MERTDDLAKRLSSIEEKLSGMASAPDDVALTLLSEAVDEVENLGRELEEGSNPEGGHSGKGGSS